MDPILTLFLGGTGIVPVFAPLLYRGMADAFRSELIKALPGLGLHSGEWTYRQTASWFDSKVKPNQKVILVGHSQGGLHAVRLGLERSNIVRVITIGTPHHGTELAWPAVLLREAGAGLSDMRPQSAYMKTYIANLPRIAPRLVSIYSRHDGLVIPYHKAHVDNATNYLFSDPNEYRVIGNHLRDTAWLEGNPKHLTGFFDKALDKALNLVHESLDPYAA